MEKGKGGREGRRQGGGIDTGGGRQGTLGWEAGMQKIGRDGRDREGKRGR